MTAVACTSTDALNQLFSFFLTVPGLLLIAEGSGGIL
jgi:hypothetical protein